jgi:hypothetical protein
MLDKRHVIFSRAHTVFTSAGCQVPLSNCYPHNDFTPQSKSPLPSAFRCFPSSALSAEHGMSHCFVVSLYNGQAQGSIVTRVKRLSQVER